MGQNVERGSEQCQAPWKAVDGFQKCYQYKYSDDVVQYIDANDICIRSKPGARLFTPGSTDETKKVDAAMILVSRRIIFHIKNRAQWQVTWLRQVILEIQVAFGQARDGLKGMLYYASLPGP